MDRPAWVRVLQVLISIGQLLRAVLRTTIS
jgi:hypothetical protein